MKNKAIIFLFLFSLLLYGKSFAQSGTLDSSFGVNGRVTTSTSNSAAIALQADGKIVVAGTYGDWFSGWTYFVVTRYKTNGNLDSSFGISGEVHTYFDTGQHTGSLTTSVLIQSDGKIIAGGYGYYTGFGPVFFSLARYLPNGDPDSTFGKNGKTQGYIGSVPKENELEGLVLQKDGKIVAGGSSDGYCVVRYKANGIIDSSFADNGVITDQEIATYGISDLLLQADGKIVTAATRQSPQDFEIIRLLQNGLRDSAFGNNGYVFTDFLGGRDNPYSIVVLDDGSILAAGYAEDNSVSATYLVLAKYNKDGSPDNSFGMNGKTKIDAPFVLPYLNVGMKVLIQNDGKIITAGTVLARFNPDGTVDSAFGVNGKAVNFDSAYDAALQPDGKVISLSTNSLSRYYLFNSVHNIKAGNWSDPSIWSNNKVPGEYDDVLLNYDVIIDVNATCRSLTPQGHAVHVNAGVQLNIVGK